MNSGADSKNDGQEEREATGGDASSLLLGSRVTAALADLRDGRITLNEVDGTLFEYIIAELMDRKGYENVEVTRTSKESGVDIYASLRDPLGGRLWFLTQCKHYRIDHGVKTGEVRALLGLVDFHRASGGIIIASSFISKGARDLEQMMPYRLMLYDHQAVHQWIREVG